MSGSDLPAARCVLINSPETWRMAVTIAGQLERSLWGKMVANERLLRMAVALLPDCVRAYDFSRPTPFTAYARPRVRAGIVKQLRPMHRDRQTRALLTAVYGQHAGRRLLVEQYHASPDVAAHRTQRLAALDAAVSRLPSDYGDIIRGGYYDGKSMAIIASGIGCSEAAVARLRDDALMRIRGELEQCDFGMSEVSP